MAETRTILVIEDDPTGRFSLVSYLEDSGFSCLEARDGMAGLEVFAQAHVDLVVTDLWMPKLDGLGVIESLQRMSPATPVILLSGMGDATVSQTAMALGARACLTKPLRGMDVLVDTIRSLIDSSDPHGGVS